jgi:hypothetical protein
MPVGNTGSPFTAELNRLANGGTYRTPLNVVGDNLAANQWAGTTGLDVQGALNTRAGRTDRKTFLDIQGICNVLASTDGLAAPEALRRISS